MQGRIRADVANIGSYRCARAAARLPGPPA